MFKKLLPPGKAWSHDLDLNLHKLIDSLAQEAVRIDGRADAILTELDPNTTTEMISDWERIVGIPDKIVQTQVAATLAQRRLDVIRKLKLQGGASASLFISVAAYFGYTVTIEETYPAQAGRTLAGMPCYSTNWLYCFRIHAPNVISNWALAGSATAGTPIQTWTNKVLEAVINNIKPAHSFAVFVYGG